jgi:hypothetical protein
MKNFKGLQIKQLTQSGFVDILFLEAEAELQIPVSQEDINTALEALYEKMIKSNTSFYLQTKEALVFVGDVQKQTIRIEPVFEDEIS